MESSPKRNSNKNNDDDNTMSEVFQSEKRLWQTILKVRVRECSHLDESILALLLNESGGTLKLPAALVATKPFSVLIGLNLVHHIRIFINPDQSIQARRKSHAVVKHMFRRIDEEFRKANTSSTTKTAPISSPDPVSLQNHPKISSGREVVFHRHCQGDGSISFTIGPASSGQAPPATTAHYMQAPPPEATRQFAAQPQDYYSYYYTDPRFSTNKTMHAPISYAVAASSGEVVNPRNAPSRTASREHLIEDQAKVVDLTQEDEPDNCSGDKKKAALSLSSGSISDELLDPFFFSRQRFLTDFDELCVFLRECNKYFSRKNTPTSNKRQKFPKKMKLTTSSGTSYRFSTANYQCLSKRALLCIAQGFGLLKDGRHCVNDNTDEFSIVREIIAAYTWVLDKCCTKLQLVSLLNGLSLLRRGKIVYDLWEQAPSKELLILAAVEAGF